MIGKGLLTINKRAKRLDKQYKGNESNPNESWANPTNLQECEI